MYILISLFHYSLKSFSASCAIFEFINYQSKWFQDFIFCVMPAMIHFIYSTFLSDVLGDVWYWAFLCCCCVVYDFFHRKRFPSSDPPMRSMHLLWFLSSDPLIQSICCGLPKTHVIAISLTRQIKIFLFLYKRNLENSCCHLKGMMSNIFIVNTNKRVQDTRCWMHLSSIPSYNEL